MKIEMMMIGAILFGMVFIVGLDIYSEMLYQYDVNIDTNTTFGKMSFNAQQIKKEASDMRESITSGSVTEGNAVDDMVLGGYSAVRNNPFTIMGIAANSTETLMMESHMVPAPVVVLLMSILGILTIFAIIALIFKFEQR